MHWRPEGFTFRNFVTDGPKTGMDAKTYIQRDLSNLPEDDYIHSDENRLVRRGQPVPGAGLLTEQTLRRKAPAG